MFCIPRCFLSPGPYGSPLEIRPHMVGIKASLLCCFLHSDGIPQAKESRLGFCPVGNKEGYHISHMQMMWCNPAAAGCWASRKVTPIPTIGICVVLIYIQRVTRPHKKHTWLHKRHHHGGGAACFSNPTPWIWWIYAAWGAGSLAYIFYEVDVEIF